MKKSVLLLIAAIFGTSLAGHAASIANWKQLNTAVTPPTSGLTTDSPTFGDGTASSGNNLWVAGSFGTTVSLNIGETLTVTGSYTVTGAETSNDFAFRHGLFNDGGKFADNDPNNWTGQQPSPGL